MSGAAWAWLLVTASGVGGLYWLYQRFGLLDLVVFGGVSLVTLFLIGASFWALGGVSHG